MPDFSTVQIKTPEFSDGLGLYVHIPFCFSKCNYCDFNTYAGIENQFTSITNALVSELNYWGEVLQRPKINTVFLGGGTPSYLPDKQKRSADDILAQPRPKSNPPSPPQPNYNDEQFKNEIDHFLYTHIFF